MTDNIIYHEIDFIIPSQKFNIQFSYVSKKGLPFIREFVLRLVHVAPLSKVQISTYFGLSRRETEEAIDDLVMRGELTLSKDGRLVLTEKANDYFSSIGEMPQLSTVLESGASLSFDLATFSCFGNRNKNDKWKSGLLLKVDDANASRSEKLVEKCFQLQFNRILDKGFLPNYLSSEGSDRPSVYTVSSVNKLRQLPLRLKTLFEMDSEGKAVERDDFEELDSSEVVHELIALELSHLSRSENTMSIFKAMLAIGDEDTLKLFDTNTNALNPKYIADLNALETHSNLGRTTFLGPIYSKGNWEKMQRVLGPLLAATIKKDADTGGNHFTWIAPSDPFWGKSDRFASSLSDFLRRASTKEKKLYEPVVYVPLLGKEDVRGAKQWGNEFEQDQRYVKGLLEGFLDGNVELMHLEDEFVVVVYHFSLPDYMPVSMPVGFISTEIEVVKRIGKLMKEYVNGNSSFDNSHDCGSISSIAKGQVAYGG